VLVESFDEELITTASTTTTTVNPSGLVAYPQLVQGLKKLFSSQLKCQSVILFEIGIKKLIIYQSLANLISCALTLDLSSKAVCPFIEAKKLPVITK